MSHNRLERRKPGRPVPDSRAISSLSAASDAGEVILVVVRGQEMTNQLSHDKAMTTPGMVLGPDGRPCKVCTAFRNWKPPTKTATAASTALASSATDNRPPDCPLDIEQLGRATWSFLHTTAAYYPDRPTPNHRANMLTLLRSLPVLYPCSHCASHLRDNFDMHPPDVSSRVSLSRWLCERHNDVNERLGKEKFDCAKTDERWRDGPPDGSCD